MGYLVVVTVPHPEEYFPDLFSTEEYSGDHYHTREEALPELEEAKKDPRFPEAWVEFRCDDDCEHCEMYNASSDLCGLIETLYSKISEKGGD